MSRRPSFAEVLDAADALSADEQEELVAIVRRRLAEQGRQRIARDIAEGEAEYAAGKLRPMSVEEIMQRVRS